jgi:8-oxo-dGTP pyrophosphatase MutT (NUDIX family)
VVHGPSLAQVRQALAEAGPPRPAEAEQAGARASAVLVPLYEHEGKVWVVLTRRAAHLRSHQGEVSFPGGGRDGDEPLVTTALREAEEEIGLRRETVEVVGELDHLATIVSGSYIVPYVGFLPGRPDDLVANPDEVEHILHVPLAELLTEEVYREELWSFAGAERQIFFFELVGDTVWGATASMLRRLLALVMGVPVD